MDRVDCLDQTTNSAGETGSRVTQPPGLHGLRADIAMGRSTGRMPMASSLPTTPPRMADVTKKLSIDGKRPCTMNADRRSREYRREMAMPSQNTNPVKAIRAKCLECMGGSSAGVDECSSVHCQLWPFRYGDNPFRAELTGAQKAERRERARRTISKPHAVRHSASRIDDKDLAGV